MFLTEPHFLDFFLCQVYCAEIVLSKLHIAVCKVWLEVGREGSDEVCVISDSRGSSATSCVVC
jgi:hypothetical protein